MENLLAVVENEVSFPRAVRYEKKRKLSSATDLVWKCICGQENEDSSERCKGCNIDDRGLAPHLSPEKIASQLKQDIGLLNSALSR